MKLKDQHLALSHKLWVSGGTILSVLLLIGITCVPASSQKPGTGPTPKPTPNPTPPAMKVVHPSSVPKPKPSPTLTPTPIPHPEVTSAKVIGNAWRALHAGNRDEALAFAKTVIDMFGKDADKQQTVRQQSGMCQERPEPATPEEKREYNHTHWALNDVATALIIRGRVLADQGNRDEARAAFNRVINSYSCAYYWDPEARRGQGMFVSAANTAERRANGLRPK